MYIVGHLGERSPFEILAFGTQYKKDLRLLINGGSQGKRVYLPDGDAVRELKALGIAIIFEKENINTLETDTEMMLTIMSCFAQAESESISKNVSWGVRQSFKNGNVPMQYARLLGYNTKRYQFRLHCMTPMEYHKAYAA